MMMDFVFGATTGVGLGVLIMAVNEIIRRERSELRKKKRDCLHEWNDAGTVSYDTVALYCPVCDSSLVVSKAAAKVALNAVMIRKLHDGSRKIQGAENNMKWSYEQEKELQRLYLRERISYGMWERMTALEELRERLTGVKRTQEDFLLRQKREDTMRNEDLRRVVQDEVKKELNRNG